MTPSLNEVLTQCRQIVIYLRDVSQLFLPNNHLFIDGGFVVENLPSLGGEYLNEINEVFLGFAALDVNNLVFKGSVTTVEKMLCSRDRRLFHDFAKSKIKVYIHRKANKWPSFMFCIGLRASWQTRTQ